MARHPRQIFPGVALHVIQRGNNRNACFRHDSDYLTYLAHLRQLSEKYGCDVHAYCLMTNHVHLLLTPSVPDACAPMMRDLGRRYVQYFNRRHERTGTLWEGRFRSCLVESAPYVLACYCYVESNPVRAGMVSHASAYPWSSHGPNTGALSDPMVKPHCEYLALSRDAYRALFERPLESELLWTIRDATNGGYPLASDAYKANVIRPSGHRAGRGKPGPRVESPEAAYCCEPG